MKGFRPTDREKFPDPSFIDRPPGRRQNGSAAGEPDDTYLIHIVLRRSTSTGKYARRRRDDPAQLSFNFATG